MGGPFDFGTVADRTRPRSCRSSRRRQCGGRRQSVSASLSCYWCVNGKKIRLKKETHNFPCPEGYLLQSKSNMLCRLVRVDVTPSVVSWMLRALQISVYCFKLGIVCKVGFTSAFFLLTRGLDRCRVLGHVSIVRSNGIVHLPDA